MIVFNNASSLIIKQRHPSCFEDWSLAILKTTKSANFEMSLESFSSDGTFKFIKKKKNYWIFKPWQFPHYLGSTSTGADCASISASSFYIGSKVLQTGRVDDDSLL